MFSSKDACSRWIFCLYLMYLSVETQAQAFTSQWVQSASVTTDVDSNNASNVTGAPDWNYWSPNITNQKIVSLQIIVKNKICIFGIAIYEFQNIGLTIGISAFSPSGKWDQLWNGSSLYRSEFGDIAFSPLLTAVNYIASQFKIDFNSAINGTPPQVDSIQIFGTSDCAGVTSQWATNVAATSEYSSESPVHQSFPASNVSGSCDGIYWLPDPFNRPIDSLTITIERSICISGIAIYEYDDTGLTVGISAFSPFHGTWDQLWTGNSKFVYFSGDLAFSPPLTAVNYTTNKFKIDFNSSLNEEMIYPAVDAIQVFGTSICAESTTTAATTMTVARTSALVGTMTPSATTTAVSTFTANPTTTTATTVAVTPASEITTAVPTTTAVNTTTTSPESILTATLAMPIGIAILILIILVLLIAGICWKKRMLKALTHSKIKVDDKPDPFSVDEMNVATVDGYLPMGIRK